jgi:hypothetical protein
VWDKELVRYLGWCFLRSIHESSRGALNLPNFSYINKAGSDTTRAATLSQQPTSLYQTIITIVVFLTLSDSLPNMTAEPTSRFTGHSDGHINGDVSGNSHDQEDGHDTGHDPKTTGTTIAEIYDNFAAGYEDKIQDRGDKTAKVSARSFHPVPTSRLHS